jgi:outer membrane receptor protein involved in Fe transport
VERDQFNPKFGLTWNLFPTTTLRVAAFKVLQRTLNLDQTLEPTQVAGFNQFFDDFNGVKSWRYGVAIDQKLSANVYAGAEFSKRDLVVPFVQLITPTISEIREVDWKESLARAYLYWTPHRWLAVSAEYQFERFDRRGELATGIEEVHTHRVPLGINFYHPSGFRARLKSTYVNQAGRFQPQTSPPSVPDSDQFWVVDVSIGYRFPKRWGLISLEVRNLLDERFKFQDTDPANPLIQPERLILGRLTLAF